MKISRALCLVIALAAQIGFSQTAPQIPTFAEYQVATEPTQITHKLLLQSAHNRRYATMLRDAATHSPDFAGHYILASWGCGASCVMAAAINAKDGTVVWLPFTVCCWTMDVTEPLEYRPDSRLLIVHGSRNEKGTGTHYYVLDPGKRQFVLLPASPNR